MCTEERDPTRAGDDQEGVRGRVHPRAWRNPHPRARYDLIVLGGGPAGYAAALTAIASGLSVALIEQNQLGGNSLNRGSIPSKALVRSGRAFDAVTNSQAFGGPALGAPAADIELVMRRMRRIRARIAESWSAERLAATGVDVFFGSARFADKKSIAVGAVQLHFKKALVATGAQPRRPDIPGLEEVGHLTSATLFHLTSLPKRLAVIGGGPLGCEMAQAFAHMGSKVTILQNEPKFLPQEERDAAEILSLCLARSGVHTRLNTQVIGARRENGEKIIDASSVGIDYSLAVDEILLSIGRVANTDTLNLDAAAIDCTACGDIRVDEFLRTRNADVFAAGDVCMPHKFSNVAEATGRMAVQNAFSGELQRHSALIIPTCTYCDPEIAHVGMHIWDAHRQQIPVKTFTVMMQDTDRAITDGRDDGFVKIHVKGGTDEIIGATIVASRASEMINEVAVVMHAKMGMRALAAVMHTYPAQSDAIRMAARAYVNSTKAGR
jgi:pyruvate/2-oxoglutarate dehydrogenase complex dihydrolipoamide dehydrogenase (E3) component